MYTEDIAVVQSSGCLRGTHHLGWGGKKPSRPWHPVLAEAMKREPESSWEEGEGSSA